MKFQKKISLYENSTGKKYDLRTKYEVYNELKKINDDVTVVMAPAFGLEYFGQQHFDDYLFPLSGFSNKKTINCNENGYYPIIKTDRYGFYNNDKIWSQDFEEVFLGDSFTAGSCVNIEDNIISNYKKNFSDKIVINLGTPGSFPLLELVKLKEAPAKCLPP